MINLKKNKGITLIALVITIIVMLILVAVTISLAVNGGLFAYAGRAVSETNEAIQREKTLGDVRPNLTIEELITELTSGEEIRYGLSADGKSFIGKPTDNPERTQNGNAECSYGQKFTEGYFLKVDMGNNEFTYFCSDTEEKNTTYFNWSFTGHVDIYALSGDFIAGEDYIDGSPVD